MASSFALSKARQGDDRNQTSTDQQVHLKHGKVTRYSLLSFEFTIDAFPFFGCFADPSIGRDGFGRLFLQAGFGHEFVQLGAVVVFGKLYFARNLFAIIK